MTPHPSQILLKCRVCGRSEYVPRQPYDPPTAAMCESICDGHEEDCCTETFYFDENGNEVSGDPQGWQ